MKYLLGLVIAFIVTVGYNFIDTYKKLATVNALAETLKVSNMKLNTKNNSLKANNKTLKASNVRLGNTNKSLNTNNKKLISTNKSLNNNNKKLIASHKAIHNKITQRRQQLAVANISRAQNKLATAGAKMAPFIGIPVVVGAIAYDINDYCSQIDEMEKFEYKLFGDSTISNYDKTVCGVDVEQELRLTASGVNNSYNSLIHSFNQNTAYASVFWKQKLQETANVMSKESAQFKKYYAEQFIKTSTYLSKQNNDGASFWKQQAIEALEYRDKVIDFYFK